MELIAAKLTSSGAVTPGYYPPEVGLFVLQGWLYELTRGTRTVLIPDRNVVSRMAQLALGWSLVGNDQLQLAASLLAFCQCFDGQIEPSTAYHELAHKTGHTAAAS